MSQFRASATELAAGLHRDNFDGGVDVRVGLGDSRCIPLKGGAIDAVIGSPPYCTQSDYGSPPDRPELAVLGAGEDDNKLLRNRMVGTPTITGEHGTPEEWDPTATEFLTGVAAHTSKGSGIYYVIYFFASTTRAASSRLSRMCIPCHSAVRVCGKWRLQY